jgi:glutamate synthase (NADPH/NADH) small chain
MSETTTNQDPAEIAKSAKKKLAELSSKGKLTPKERLAIEPQLMPVQYPVKRRKNINEVALGYSAEQAQIEAMRCIECKNAPCVDGCPVRINIPGFVKAIAEGDFSSAINIIKENNILPAVCGRVCPQETQCQEKCTVGKVLKDTEKSVSIGRLERFAADIGRETGAMKTPTVKPETGKKAAIIGSGPAGLVVAADLRREGHSVTIFEAFHKPGGVMVYGIPEFRLPKKIVRQEIDALTAMGVKIVTNFVIGKTRKLMDLIEKDGFDAVFIGTGAGLPKFMEIEGENLVGVFSANEYLTRANLMKAYDAKADTPIYNSHKVVVLGGGNVAMDAARTAVRLGAEEVLLLYRRTEKEMPARTEESAHAKEEGIQFHMLTNVKKFIGDEYGILSKLECLRYELGEPDSSGRRRPVEITNSEFIVEADTAIVAIGNDSNPLIKQTTQGLSVNKWGNIITDENQKTSINKIYAGGDIVLGAATVILAMGQGRTAAKAINKILAK